MAQNGRMRPTADQDFKAMMRDPRVLACLLRIAVPEMEDTSAETVHEMMKNGTIAPLNTELVTPMGRPMRMDVFYKVLLPGGRWA